MEGVRMSTLRPYSLLLPASIPAFVGHEMNIYFDNLIPGDDGNYEFEVVCEIGRHQNERWTVVPEKEGLYALTIHLYSLDGERLASADSTVTVAKRTTENGPMRKALFIGDSTTAAGVFTEELLHLFDDDPLRLTLIGTQGTSPNVHEGRAGWKVESHFSMHESAFVIEGNFDFANYMQVNGFSGLNHVGIFLGINDVWHCKDDSSMQQLMDKEMPMLEEIVRQIRHYDAGIAIGIMLIIPPPRTQDGFGNSYGTKQTRRRYKRNVWMWNQELAGRFGNRHAESIELIPLHVNLDTVHNMPGVWEEANSRNSKQVWRQNDDVHPTVEGYRQIADTIYYWLRTL
ncbi:hypothetical protein DQG23_21710 [Paenibacillus contaminans]|uniref:SGNH hydrolase-type esterase domain-containing protein n=2 Tax=Paenibacillus contaminans TaxID=450362 RepID=A0A329MGX9_9BACL|nr:hypothetical protein DQG23_21710 [Paenibacillus contaminans]